MSDEIDRITDYIAHNQLDRALDLFQNIFTMAESELANDIVYLQAQFKKNESDKRRGVLNFEEEERRRSKLLDAVLHLLDELRNNADYLEKYSKINAMLDESSDGIHKAAPILESERNSLFQRMSFVRSKVEEFSVLWIDDSIQNTQYERKVLGMLNVRFDLALSSEQAQEFLKVNEYALIISDIGRKGRKNEGLLFHKELVQRGVKTPLVFYIGNHSPKHGVPPFAFGITNLTSELFHLVMDVMERRL